MYLEADDGSDLESILSDEDEYYKAEDIIMPPEEPLPPTAYRTESEIRDSLVDWFGPSGLQLFEEASYKTRQVIETEMSILTPAEEKIHRVQMEEAMLKELRDWHDLESWKLNLRAGASNIIDSKWVKSGSV